MIPWSLFVKIWKHLQVSLSSIMSIRSEERLTLCLTEHDTRRAAATEFTRALMQLFEQQITTIIGGHIERFLQVSARATVSSRSFGLNCYSFKIYASNPAGEWRAKDTAVYLLTSIASRGSTQHVSP